MEPIGRVESCWWPLVDLGNARRVLRTPAKDGARDQRRVEDMLHAPLVTSRSFQRTTGLCRRTPPECGKSSVGIVARMVKKPGVPCRTVDSVVELAWPERLGAHSFAQEELHLAPRMRHTAGSPFSEVGWPGIRQCGTISGPE